MEALHYLFYVYIYIVSLQYSIVIVKDKTGGLKYCHNPILLCVTWKKLYVIHTSEQLEHTEILNNNEYHWLKKYQGL